MSTTSTRTAVWPTLLYRDADAAIAFLIEAFGFEETAVYRSDDGTVVDRAELRWPEGGGVMRGTHRPESGIAELPPGVGAIYVVVTDHDALYERAKARGASITREYAMRSTALAGSRRAIPRASSGASEPTLVPDQVMADTRGETMAT
jgi:uncharacterized glyoxalase superfamily protein PhnB